MNKDRMIRFLKRQWILIWLIVASLSLILLISFAAYKNANNKIKRVIAPAAKTEGLFTSNYLALGSNNVKPAYFQDDDDFEYTVSIRNYNPVDPNARYNGTISYILSVELVHSDETSWSSADLSGWNGSIDITMGQETTTLNSSNLSHSFNQQTLTGSGNDGEDFWNVTYNDIDLDSDYCVKFTATTSNSDLENIYATVIVASYPVVHPQGWSCALVERSSGKSINAFDGFNYTISGTGQQTIKFSYDSSKLEMNPACYGMFQEIASPSSYSGSGSHGSDWKTVVITADPDTYNVNRYDIQMYKVDSYQPSSYDDIDPTIANAYVEFE